MVSEESLQRRINEERRRRVRIKKRIEKGDRIKKLRRELKALRRTPDSILVAQEKGRKALARVKSSKGFKAVKKQVSRIREQQLRDARTAKKRIGKKRNLNKSIFSDLEI